MAESTQTQVVEIAKPDILANAIVTGPNILPVDPSAAPAVPPEPVADGGEGEGAVGAVAVEEADTTASPAGDGEGEADAAEREGEAEGEDGDESQPQAQRKHSFGARFSDLTHERDVAKQEAEYWKKVALEREAREQAERAQQSQQPQQPQQPPPQQQPHGIPRYPNGLPIPPIEDQFPTHDDYLVAQNLYTHATMQWHVSQQVQQALAIERQVQANERALEAARKEHTDYDAKLQEVASIQFSPDASQALLSSHNRHEILYRLATHPDEARILSTLVGPAAYLAVGRMEGLIQPATNGRNGSSPSSSPTEAQEPPIPKVSQAPPPIQPTRGNGAPPRRDYDSMPLHEFIEVRNREESKARR